MRRATYAPLRLPAPGRRAQALPAAATALSAATLRAYWETEYRVDAALPLVLRIGRFNPALARLYRMHGVESGAFVTACNPRSRLLAPARNRARQMALRRRLQAHAWPLLTGVGQHPDGNWPGEASFLVLGIARAQAQALGRRFEQNALVWCGASAVPRLLLLPAAFSRRRAAPCGRIFADGR